MKIILFIVFCLLSLHYVGLTQIDMSKIPKVILLDKSVLAGVGLEKIDLKDEPEKDFYQKQLFRGEDISVYVVSTQTWNNTMDDFPFDEFIYMFHGEAVVKPKVGPTQLFYSGDYFFAPKGYTGQWDIKAGENLHYELSVIATKRSDSATIKPGAQHKLFSPSLLSGTSIVLDEAGEFRQLIERGAELTIELKAAKSQTKYIVNDAREQMIHLLSGAIEITNADDTTQSFYAGDFFIIPKGFSGPWELEGHGLVKYLAVSRT